MITHLVIPPTPAERRARLERELAGYRHTQQTMPYPPALASALRCLIASAQAQIAALDDAAEQDERRAA